MLRLGFNLFNNGIRSIVRQSILPYSNSNLRHGLPTTASRELQTSSQLYRVIWSLKRTPKRIPNMPIPRYLKDGKMRRGRYRSGRDETGRIVIRHKGGGHPQTYRKIDFLRAPLEPEASASSPMYHRYEILQIGYDPCRTGRIALVAGNSSDYFKLILVPYEAKVGDILTASRGKPESLARLKPGDAHPIQTLPIGCAVHSVETEPGIGGRLVRSAGTSATIIRRTVKEGNTFVTIKMPSKVEKEIPGDCLAVFGRMSNIGHNKEIIGKAGRSRWLGRRPKGRSGIGRFHNWKKRVGCRKRKD